MTGSSIDNDDNNNNKKKINVVDREIGREDLQLMLRPKLGERLIVNETRQSSLLPVGENFACFILKIVARISFLFENNNNNNYDEEKELNLVAKLYPRYDYISTVFDFTIFFKKEIFFYEKIVPTLKKISRDLTKLDFDFVPEYFGARSSADPKSKRVDENVVVLMENLKSKGYYTGDKVQGLDLEHSRLTVSSLARFHANVMACKYHYPDFFENEIKDYARPVPYKEKIDVFKLMVGMMFADERIDALKERILKFFGDPEKKRKFFDYIPEEPWRGIAHLDFWTNNIMFKNNEENKKPIDVKFIDFQNYAYNSPLRDLPYFLCTSTSQEVMNRHFDQLVDLYYETFVTTLEQLRCDVTPFNRESFDRQLKIDASIEFFHNILAIKFFCAEIDVDTYEPNQMEKVVICSQISKLGLDKWYNLILTYIKRGWM